MQREFRTLAKIVGTYRNEQAPTWAPDGKHIAFMQSIGRGDPVTPEGSLYLLDIATGEIQQLGKQHWRVSSPDKWSPDGSQIAVLGNNGIWLVSTTDGTARYLARGEDAAWSPDGKQLAIIRSPSSGAPQDRLQIVFVTTDGKELNTITAQVIGPPPPTPRPLPTPPNPYTPMPIFLLPIRPFVQGIDWSPDGQRIVYGMAFPDNDRSNLFIINTDGSGLRQLTVDGYSADPAWSPDGRKIAYTFSLDGITPDLFVITPHGDCQVRLSHGGYVWHPSWSPDSRQIAISESNTNALLILDVEQALIGKLDSSNCQ
jgi:TolB protein